MTTRKCIICEDDFDSEDPRKKKIGGRINHCPDCSIEKDPPRIFGAVDPAANITKIIKTSPPPKKKVEEIRIVIGNNPRTFEEDNSGEYIEFTLDDD